jgi:hypothetical protein
LCDDDVDVVNEDDSDAVNDNILDQDQDHQQYNLEQHRLEVETFDHLYAQVNKVIFKGFLYNNICT